MNELKLNWKNKFLKSHCECELCRYLSNAMNNDLVRKPIEMWLDFPVMTLFQINFILHQPNKVFIFFKKWKNSLIQQSRQHKFSVYERLHALKSFSPTKLEREKNSNIFILILNEITNIFALKTCVFQLHFVTFR